MSRLIKGNNDITTLFPHLVDEWDYDKNLPYVPSDFTRGSKRKVWWNCKVCGNTWESTIGSRTQGCGCPECGKRKATQRYKELSVKENSLATEFPELIEEWDYDKNLPYTPEMITHATHRKFWWIGKCGHSFYSSVANRTYNKRGCPYCNSKIIIPGKNDLLSQNPILAREWDFEINHPLTPDNVFANSGKKYGWICAFCGHKWNASISNRAKGKGCPQCNISGTSFPEQAIYHYVKSFFADALNRYSFSGVEIDVFIPSKNIGIEYDGYFYHKNKLSNDNDKDLFLSEHGVRLIRFRDPSLSDTVMSNRITCVDGNLNDLEKAIMRLLQSLNIYW